MIHIWMHFQMIGSGQMWPFRTLRVNRILCDSLSRTRLLETKLKEVLVGLPSVLSSLRRQVWSAVKRLDTIPPKLLIMFETAPLRWCSSEIFKVVFTSGSNPIPFRISDDATTNWATPPTTKKWNSQEKWNYQH